MPLRAMSSRAAHTSLARVSSRRRAPRPLAALRCADAEALVPSPFTPGRYRRSDDYVKSDESIRSRGHLPTSDRAATALISFASGFVTNPARTARSVAWLNADT